MSLKSGKQSTSFWDERRNKVFSKRGGWIIGEGVFNCGYNMMDDLVGKVSYMQVVILNATGRLPDRKLADWFEAVHICLSWPDPRIWCNQIGALGGTMRTSVVSATVAGILAADSRNYGTKPLVAGVSFIQEAMVAYNNGLSVPEIVNKECARYGGKPMIMGYARPIAKGDERIEAMERVSQALGYTIGPHLDLAYQIERVLLDEFNESMNINGYMSAFLSDQGLTSEEVYRICAVLVTSGVTACYLDMSGRAEGSFMPLQCNDIEYQGKPARGVFE